MSYKISKIHKNIYCVNNIFTMISTIQSQFSKLIPKICYLLLQHNIIKYNYYILKA